MAHSDNINFNSSKIDNSQLEDNTSIDQSNSSSATVTTTVKCSSKVNDFVMLLKHGYVLFNKKLGEGTYSKVKHAYSKKQNRDIAIKIINRKIAPKEFLKRFLPRELEIIGNIEHPNICKCFEVLDAGCKVYLCLEFAQGGDLLEYIKKHKIMSESVAKVFFSQVLDAILYLHSKNILHRDLKCENILIGDKLKPLLADFGFAKYVKNNDLSRTFCGSSAYASIEILKGIAYDGKCAEVWSLGCILYIITTGNMPFNDFDKVKQIKQMERGPAYRNLQQPISNTLRQLISRMLDIDPKTRVTLKEIGKLSWMKE
nr:testis-specific serine/threonine-protein kinase 3-like [Hydra vulgaris]